MAEKKTEKTEQEYVIPLRGKFRHVARYKKTPKAVKTIKEFIARHMKIYDRNLNKIKLDKYLNEFLWARGIKNPMHKIKVLAKKEGDIVKVELIDLPDKLKFKKLREEKLSKEAKESLEKKKTLKEKMQEAVKGKDKEEKEESESGVEKETETKEKKEAVKEAGAKMEKELSKQMKHSVGGKTKKQTHPVRQAMAK